jgi:hypothetical protein
MGLLAGSPFLPRAEVANCQDLSVPDKTPQELRPQTQQSLNLKRRDRLRDTYDESEGDKIERRVVGAPVNGGSGVV